VAGKKEAGAGARGEPEFGDWSPSLLRPPLRPSLYMQPACAAEAGSLVGRTKAGVRPHSVSEAGDCTARGGPIGYEA